MCLNWKEEVFNYKTVILRFLSPLKAAILEAFMFIAQSVKLEVFQHRRRSMGALSKLCRLGKIQKVETLEVV